jgi:predicted SprT family Zn-dependent metalloprotease
MAAPDRTCCLIFWVDAIRGATLALDQRTAAGALARIPSTSLPRQYWSVTRTLARLAPHDLHPRLIRWCRTWRVPGLTRRLTIEFSPRMRTSLGSCDPHSNTIRLAAWLLNAPRELLDEALCHEAAHAAVVELYGRKVRPHAPEWRALMTAAGFEPRVRLPRELLPRSVQRATRSRAPAYEHCCTVCHAFRIARRPMRNWRCARCIDAGLSGTLDIVSRPGARP